MNGPVFRAGLERSPRKSITIVGCVAVACLAGCSRPFGTSNEPALLETGVPSARHGSEEMQPNIVLIVSDDHRADVLSCAGNPYIQTPNIDRLASEGVRFLNAFSTSGVCSPSRGSILTGKYAHQCGAPRITWMNNTFHRQETPFPARLHEAGYHTAHIGKWHLGAGNRPKPGYDYWAGFEWLGRYFNPKITVNGVEKEFEGYSDDILSELAADYIAERAQSGGPFSLYVGLKAPHLRFEYPERHEHAFDEISIPKPASYDEDYGRSGKPALIGNQIRIETFRGGLPAFDNSWDKYIKSYYRCVLAINDAVGRILQALDQAGIAENTIVIYTSDQGYSLGEHGLTEKHYAYENPMRIPLVMRYPKKVRPGTICDEMVLNIDIAPTVLDLCGEVIPEDMEGHSWAPLLETPVGQAPAWRTDFLFDLSSEGRNIPSQLAVRTRTHKLITYPDLPYRELYDLQEDPHEMTNLVDNPAYEDVLADLERRLERLIHGTAWVSHSSVPVLKCWVLGPIPRDSLDAVRSLVLGQRFRMSEIPPGVSEGQRAWRPLAADDSGVLCIGEGEPDHSTFFLGIPVERLVPRDPYTELRVQPFCPLKGYVNGIQYIEVTASTTGPSRIFNPPLPERENLIVLEIPPGSPRNLSIQVYAPIGSIQMGGDGP